jgi:hypothetical protein
MIVGGLGIGLVNPPLASTAVGEVPPQRAGMASGINTTFRQVGIATGVAALGAIFQSRIDSELSARLPHAPNGLGELVASGGSRAVEEALGHRATPQILHAADAAFVCGFNEIILIAAIVSFVGAAAGFALVRSKDFVQPTGGPADPGT